MVPGPVYGNSALKLKKEIVIKILKYIVLSIFVLPHLLVQASIFDFGNSSKFKVPELTGPVVDQAQVIDSATLDKLQKLLFLAERQNQVQLQILTLKTLSGLPIEEASIKIVEQWKLGKADSDKGVLFLVVPSERKARIEVGQGLEGDIPDAIAKRILADVSRPFFKSGDYSGGIYAGSLEILKYAGVIKEQNQSPSQNERVRYRTPEEELISYLIDKFGFGIFIILFILFTFLRMISPFGFRVGSRRRGPWGGGGWPGGGSGGFGGGGGWSGGGGGFSGGGSSDSW